MKVKRGEIYKCKHCGLIIEVLEDSDPDLVCCGDFMTKMEPNSNDAGATEKHVPVIEETDLGYTVRVGSIPHPMEETHWIEWIELIVDGVAHRAYLAPGSEPVATFAVSKGRAVTAREYCNLHGLWTADL